MILVLQGPGLDASALEEAKRRCGAGRAVQIGPQAWRLEDVDTDEGLAAWCASRRIDCARIPADRRRSELKLLAIDMDSTLITIECIDEIGALLGRKEEIAAITEEAMRGEIAYAESLARRVALLEGLEEAALEKVYRDTLRLSPGAERLVASCRREGIHTLLVSGGFTFFTDRLKERLGIDETLANVLEVERGRLTGRIVGHIVGARTKAARFRETMEKLRLVAVQTLAVGDGANDMLMMAEAGVSVAWRGKPKVRAAATHALDFAELDGVLNLYM